MLRVARVKKRSKRSSVERKALEKVECGEKSARKGRAVCGVLGESREVHVYERCTCTRCTCTRGARPELGAVVLWSTRSREVATPSFFLLFGLCVNDCGKAPVGDI